MTSSDSEPDSGSGDASSQPGQGEGSSLPPTHQPYGGPSGPPPAPNPYGEAPAQPGYGYATPVAPHHPSATTSLVLGLVGLAGVLFCGGLTLVLSPVAWSMGAKAVREIDARPGVYGGRDQANAARVMGIIGTVLLGLGILLVLGLIALVAAGSTASITTG